MEAAGDACSRRCLTSDMGHHRTAWWALFRMQQAKCLRPRRQNRGNQKWPMKSRRTAGTNEQQPATHNKHIHDVVRHNMHQVCEGEGGRHTRESH